MTFILVIVILALAALGVFMVSRWSSARAGKGQARLKPSAKRSAAIQPVSVQATAIKTEPTITKVTEAISDDPDEVLGIKDHTKKKAAKPFRQVPRNTEDLIQLNVFSPKDKVYKGYDLMRTLISTGMRHGDMNIFHRHEQKVGKGPVVFSLACAEEPGTFDLPKMGTFECRGLVLFMQPSSLKDPVATFELMMDVAGQLAQDMGGEVLDDRYHLLATSRVVDINKQLRGVLTKRREKAEAAAKQQQQPPVTN